MSRKFLYLSILTLLGLLVSLSGVAQGGLQPALADGTLNGGPYSLSSGFWLGGVAGGDPPAPAPLPTSTSTPVPVPGGNQVYLPVVVK